MFKKLLHVSLFKGKDHSKNFLLMDNIVRGKTNLENHALDYHLALLIGSTDLEQ